jgi:hypothetical protein
MKKFAFLLALIASFAVLSPVTSEARDYRRGHGHGSYGSSRQIVYHCRHCGSGIYRQRYYVGHGRYSWRTQPHYCRYNSHRHHHHGGYRRGSRVRIGIGF